MCLFQKIYLKFNYPSFKVHDSYNVAIFDHKACHLKRNSGPCLPKANLSQVICMAATGWVTAHSRPGSHKRVWKEMWFFLFVSVIIGSRNCNRKQMPNTYQTTFQLSCVWFTLYPSLSSTVETPIVRCKRDFEFTL